LLPFDFFVGAYAKETISCPRKCNVKKAFLLFFHDQFSKDQWIALLLPLPFHPAAGTKASAPFGGLSLD